ncbi:Hypothetical Protein FCC1311_015122 [Hondaea fermentalgiana]|uniref:Protein RFT1 homolog n=1 Tax=Hondaea fermentalgiana TaxID=2315210 RepID=A0A2R5G413_9STRA|nr:Hypothetical Protein FCC1311_015122 [Hondaea fermentalgiana]|eukprot:GBG25295.1 Hypothetical Protein FCC1311_015122 [Hondaea fermentalgiana]
MVKMNSHRRLALYASLIVIGYAAGYGLDMLSSVLMSQDAAATLASYALVRQTGTLAVSLFRFIASAGRAIVARKDAAKHYEPLPTIVRQILLFSAATSVLGCVVILVARDELLAGVNTEGEELVPESESALIIFSVGAIFSGIYASLYAVLIGLFQFGFLLTLGISSGITFSFLSLFLFLHTDLGINAFSIAYFAYNILCVALSLFFIYGWPSNRARYNFRLFGASSASAPSVREWISEFRKSISWLWGQSATYVIKNFIAIYLVTRSSPTKGSLYALLMSFTGITSLVADGAGYVTTITAPRLIGVGDVSGNKNYASFFTLSNFFLRFNGLWSICTCVALIVLGKSLVLSSSSMADDGSSVYEDLISTQLFVLVGFHQIVVSLSVTLEALLVGAHDFRFVGQESLVAFLVGFLPVILAAAYTDGPVEMFLAAETLFYGIRMILTLARWLVVIKPQLQSALLTEQQTQSARQALEDDPQPSRCSCCHLFVSVLCCGQAFDAVKLVIDDLAKSIDRTPPRAVDPELVAESDAK